MLAHLPALIPDHAKFYFFFWLSICFILINFYLKKINLARSVRCFSTLIWFSFKVLVFIYILFILGSKSFGQSNSICTCSRVQTLFKNIVMAVAATCCFLNFFLSQYILGIRQYLMENIDNI